MFKLVILNKENLAEVRFGKKQISVRDLLKKENLSKEEDKFSFLENLSKTIIANGNDTMLEYHTKGVVFYLGEYRSMRDHTPWIFNPTLSYYTPNTGIGALTEKWYEYEFPKGIVAGMEQYGESNAVYTSKKTGINPVLVTLLKSEFMYELDALAKAKEEGLNLMLTKDQWEILLKNFSKHQLRDKYFSEMAYYSPLVKFI